MYKVHAQVMVEDNPGAPSSSYGNLAINYTGIYAPRSNIYNQLAVLQTRDLLVSVVNNLNLNVAYYHKGNIRDVELYKDCPFQVVQIPYSTFYAPESFEFIFSKNNPGQYLLKNESITVRGSFNDTLRLPNAMYYITETGKPRDSQASYYFTISSSEQAVNSIAANLYSELMASKASVINLSFNTNVPVKGEDVLRQVIQSYINRNLSEKNRMNDSTIDFINNRIDIVAGELGIIEGNIQNFKQDNKITDLSAQAELLVSRTGAFYEQLNDLEVKLSVLNATLSYLEDEKNNYRPVPALLDNESNFSGLFSKYNEMLIARDKLLLSVKENNPITNNLEEQIANIRSDLIKSLNSQKRALIISRNKIVTENNIATSQIGNIPLQERQYINLTRDKDLKQNLYLYLLQKKEETAISKAASMANINVIETPKSDLGPYAPEKNAAISTGVMYGLAIPTALIFLSMVLNNKITRREDVTNATNTTILAEIGHRSESEILSMEDEGRSIIAEQFRIFRTNMDFVTGSVQSPIVHVTSSMTGEGKSFIALNLAQVYAYSGKRVLLMELDLRKPKLSSLLGIKNEIGFSNFIISSSHIRNLLNQFQEDLIYFYLVPDLFLQILRSY